MTLKKFTLVTFACVLGMTASVVAQDENWDGGGADNLINNPLNWTNDTVPTGFGRFPLDNATVDIDSSVNITVDGLEFGHPGANDPNTNFPNSASMTINMTGGTVTALTNISNLGRGNTTDVNHNVTFNMSGGLLDLRGLSMPEYFTNTCSGPLGSLCQPMSTDFNVSGSSVVNTDFLRFGSGDSVSNMVISDNAVVNVLARGINGFTNGSIWLETGFNGPVNGDGATIDSLLDIRDDGVLTVHGIHFVGRDATTNAANGSIATQAEFDYYVEQYVDNNLIVANGGANLVDASFANGVMTFRVGEVVPEPSAWALLLCTIPFVLRMRRKR